MVVERSGGHDDGCAPWDKQHGTVLSRHALLPTPAGRVALISGSGCAIHPLDRRRGDDAGNKHEGNRDKDGGDNGHGDARDGDKGGGDEGKGARATGVRATGTRVTGTRARAVEHV